MNIKNKPAVFFALFLLLFIGYIIFWTTTKPVSVIVQAGHEGRVVGNTGAESKHYREETWNILVADEVAKKLKSWQIDVKRVPAEVSFSRANIAVSIHFDGSTVPCSSGASIGYKDDDAEAFALRWKTLYRDYFPYKWNKDNFTDNLKNYYAYHWIRANKFLVLELGEITCEKQTKWLKPRLKKIAHLVAYSIAKELGRDVKRPHF